MGFPPQLTALLMQAAQNGQAPPAPQSPPPPAPGMDAMNSSMFPALFPQTPQTQPAPTASPAGALPATSPFSMASMVSQVAGLPEYKSATGSLEDIRRQEQDIQGRLSSRPMPKTSWLDTQGQPPKPGIGHEILRGLIALAGATVPGQAIQQGIYGPGVRRYGEETKSLADQLAALKSQEAIPTEELRALSGMTGTAARTYIGQENVDVRKQRADQQAMAISNRYAVDLQRLQQGAQRLSIEQQGIEIKKWFDKGLLEAMNTRIAAGQDENSARISAQEDMKAALSQNQWALQHPIMNMLGIAPTIQAAPGAATKPVNTPAKTPAGKANQIKKSRPVGDTVNF